MDTHEELQQALREIEAQTYNARYPRLMMQEEPTKARNLSNE